MSAWLMDPMSLPKCSHEAMPAAQQMPPAAARCSKVWTGPCENQLSAQIMIAGCCIDSCSIFEQEA